MDHTERRSGAAKSGCKNCGNCAKGGCGSIAAELKIDGGPVVFATRTAPAPGDTGSVRILAAE